MVPNQTNTPGNVPAKDRSGHDVGMAATVPHVLCLSFPNPGNSERTQEGAWVSKNCTNEMCDYNQSVLLKEMFHAHTNRLKGNLR